MELPGPLGDMQALSTELQRVSLLGACAQEQPDQEPSEPHLLRLLRLREQVKHQRLEVQTVAEASDEVSPEALSSAKLAEIAKELLKDIEDVKVSYQNKTKVLQRMQFVNALLSKIQEADGESKLIQEKFTHILTLSTATIISQQETRELEDRLYDIRKKRLMLKELGSAKMLEIQTVKSNWKVNREEIQNDKLKRLHKILKEEIDSSTVLQNVFQNIILASHVDWAQDPQLTDIVLKLETNASSYT